MGQKIGCQSENQDRSEKVKRINERRLADAI